MIVSRQNRRIKDIRRLRRSKGDRALIEGPHLLAAALAAEIELEYVLATPEFADGAEAARLLEPCSGRVELVRDDLLGSVADSDSPRGVLAVARLPRPGSAALPRVREGLYVWADGLQEPGNLGALARVAEAAGASALALSPASVHPNHPRALRASAGSLLRLPIGREVALDELERHLREEEPELVALVPRGGEELYAAAPTAAGAVILLLGAEGPGLAEEITRRADRRLTVPMRAPVESLNATVAAALALYELQRRRGALADGR